MPVVDAGMDSACLGDIHVAVSSTVTRGQTLFVVEADKIDLEIEAPVDGEVVEIRETTGAELAPGAVVLVLRTRSPGS